MNQPLRMSSAVSLIALGSIMAGCAAQHTHMGAASFVGSKPAELGFATRALAALNSNNAPLAVDFAQKAVARSPGEASVRTLLGNAYFAAGRFASAEDAYRDSLTLDSNQPAVVLKLALVEIAQGKDNRAVAMLKEARGQLEASDYGLALALAGRSAEAIDVLEPAARQQGADATVRQNLALAHALAGDWNEARVIAGQDVPANQLDQRMSQWMQLSKPRNAADQVAAVTGVTPSLIDPGQPVALALNKPATSQPQRLASVGSGPSRPLVDAAQPQSRPTAEAPRPGLVTPTQALPAPVMVPAIAAAVPARPAVATLASSAVNEARAVLASFMPQHRSSLPKKLRPAAAPAARASTVGSTSVVQLGAYGSPERVLAAWNSESRKFGALKPYAPMSARFASAKGTFYRLSVRGFASVTEAKALCASLHRAGGACFVRNVAGDAPVNIALR